MPLVTNNLRTNVTEPMTVAEIQAWLHENPQARVSECLAAWTPGDLR